MFAAYLVVITAGLIVYIAVGTMAVFTIYLRQRGSPESKPVGAPHDETGSSG